MLKEAPMPTKYESMARLAEQMSRAEGVTEKLKAHDQMVAVWIVNYCKARVEKIIFPELIYC